MNRRWLKVFAIIFPSFVAVWAAGFMAFVYHAYNYPLNLDQTEGIVILTGGTDRLKTGLELLKQDKSENLFISGVHKNVGLDEINKDIDLSGHITLGYLAESTLENAKETAQWVKKHKFDSLRLVTSFYHMPRSLLEFKTILPAVKIIPHPVISKRFKRAAWWQDTSILKVLLSEYHKYLLMSLRISMGLRV